jgi:ribonuclease BN (tRNA processing enzyme)
LELLKDEGYSISLINDSLMAEEIIRAEKPALVILDILMPGLDGLTLLHRLKSDPATAKIKAVIVSGKSFLAEKQRAAQYGAEAFIEKPYEVELFAQKIIEILASIGVKGNKAPRQSSGTTATLRAAVTATVWGCRSASPDGTPASARYGTRTSCVSVETPSHHFVFDAGTGIEKLGVHLATPGKPKVLWLFLTHFHKDHVEGLATFSCARDKEYTLHVSGASDPDKPFDQALKAALGAAMPPARIEFYELMEQTYEILPGVRLSAFYANHPGTTFGYILQADDRKIVYCPDSELYGDNATALQDYDEKIGAACRNADLLFHDGRYTPEDYKKNKNTGHSNFIAAVDFAGKNLVKKLVLVHQDARYDDAALDKMDKDAKARVAAKGYKLEVSVGREGLVVNI